MRLKRKAALLLMAATLCVGMPANSVEATSGTCSHWQTGDRPGEYILKSRTTHNIYSEWFDGEGRPIYAVCNIEHYWYMSVKQCTRCYIFIRTHIPERDYEIHSLASNKYHPAVG